MSVKDLMNVIPMIQSASLVGENIKVLNKKKIGSKDIVSLGIKNVVGTSLIKMESDFIGDL